MSTAAATLLGNRTGQQERNEVVTSEEAAAMAEEERKLQRMPSRRPQHLQDLLNSVAESKEAAEAAMAAAGSSTGEEDSDNCDSAERGVSQAEAPLLGRKEPSSGQQQIVRPAEEKLPVVPAGSGANANSSDKSIAGKNPASPADSNEVSIDVEDDRRTSGVAAATSAARRPSVSLEESGDEELAGLKAHLKMEEEEDSKDSRLFAISFFSV